MAEAKATEEQVLGGGSRARVAAARGGSAPTCSNSQNAGVCKGNVSQGVKACHKTTASRCQGGAGCMLVGVTCRAHLLLHFKGEGGQGGEGSSPHLQQQQMQD